MSISTLTKNYTKIPNEILEENQISLTGRLLYILLVKYLGNKDICYPSEKTLSRHLDISVRQIRNKIQELRDAGLIYYYRKGFNRANTYKISTNLSRDFDKKTSSYHIGSIFPLHTSQLVPPNSTYLKETEKSSVDNLELKRKELFKKIWVGKHLSNNQHS